MMGPSLMDIAVLTWQLLVFGLLPGAVTSAALTWPLMRWLSAKQFGKAIRVDGPDHAAKSGTPTMGGIGMLITAALAIIIAVLWLQTLFVDDPLDSNRIASVIRGYGVVFAGLVVFSAIGLIDDLQGLARKSGKRELGVGLKARHMFLIQGLAAFALCFGLMATNSLVLPGSLPTWLALTFASLIVVGCVNGVNLSDGLDGLAAGLIFLAFVALALAIGFSEPSPESEFMVRDLVALYASFALGMIALATAGACLGFLIFNRHPAKVFMGNVASMGLGALLALLSLMSGVWILLPIFGAVFVAEVLSVVLQVGYFKYSGGKRIFRMAPFHHHFEQGGMHETTIVRRFWTAGLVAAGAAVALAGPVLDRFAVLLPTYQ